MIRCDVISYFANAVRKSHNSDSLHVSMKVRVAPSISEPTVFKTEGPSLALISLRITLMPQIPKVSRK